MTEVRTTNDALRTCAAYALVTVAVESSTSPFALRAQRALGWSVEPERASAFYAWMFAVTALKPLWASIGDRDGRGVSRRLVVSVGCAVSALGTIGMSRATNSFAVYASGTLAAGGASAAYATLDGSIVRLGRKGVDGEDAALTARTQALAMGARTLGAGLGELAGAGALAAVSADGATAAAGGWFAIAAVAAWTCVREDDDDDAYDIVDDDGTEIDESGRRTKGASASGRARGVGEQLRDVLRTLSDATFARCAACVFLYRLAPTALDAFASYTYAVFGEVVPNWGFALAQFFASLGALCAPAAFGWAFGGSSTQATSFGEERGGMLERARAWFVAAPLWMMFILGALVDAMMGLSRLALVWQRPSSGAVASISLVNALSTFGLRVGYMPIVTLGALIAPRNLEGVGFATLVFASDVGSLVSAGVSGALVRAMSIGDPTSTDPQGAVTPTGRSWRPLTAFLFLVFACKCIIPAVASPPLLRAAGPRPGRRLAPTREFARVPTHETSDTASTVHCTPV